MMCNRTWEIGATAGLLLALAAVFAGLLPWARLNAALATAIGNRDRAAVTELIHKGAWVNMSDPSGETALVYACREGDLVLVRELLARGADVTSRDERGWTALICASRGPDAEVLLKLLLDHGADVNAKGSGGVTALMAAAQECQVELVDLLIQKGADVNAKDEDGYTALMISEEEPLRMVELESKLREEIARLLNDAAAKKKAGPSQPSLPARSGSARVMRVADQEQSNGEQIPQ